MDEPLRRDVLTQAYTKCETIRVDRYAIMDFVQAINEIPQDAIIEHEPHLERRLGVMAAGLVEMIRGKRESEQICSVASALSLILYAGYLIESIETAGTTGIKC